MTDSKSKPRRPNGKADRLRRAYRDGVAAAGAGAAIQSCPYRVPQHVGAWRLGFNEAEQ